METRDAWVFSASKHRHARGPSEGEGWSNFLLSTSITDIPEHLALLIYYAPLQPLWLPWQKRLDNGPV